MATTFSRDTLSMLRTSDVLRPSGTVTGPALAMRPPSTFTPEAVSLPPSSSTLPSWVAPVVLAALGVGLVYAVSQVP